MTMTAEYANAAAAGVHALGFVEPPSIYLFLTLVRRMLDQQQVLRNPWQLWSGSCKYT